MRVLLLMERKPSRSLEAAVAGLREVSRKVDRLLSDTLDRNTAELQAIRAESQTSLSYYESLLPMKPVSAKPSPGTPAIVQQAALAAFGSTFVGLAPPQVKLG